MILSLCASALQAPADVGAALHKPAWAGALVPEVEIEQGDLTVIVVKLIDDRQALLRQPFLWPGSPACFDTVSQPADQCQF